MLDNFTVEFSGLAGAGKSYVSKRLKRKLEQRGIVVEDTVSVKVSVVFALINLPLFITCLFWIIKSKPASFAGFYGAAVGWYKTQLKIKRFRAVSGVCLIDEGYVHRFREIRRESRKRNLRLSDHYSSDFVTSDFLVIVNSDAASISARRAVRDDLIITPAQAALALARMEYTVEDADFLRSQQRGFDYVEIENGPKEVLETELDQLAETIINRYNRQ